MNGYKAFYKGKEAIIFAESLYKAKLKAIEVLKPRKSQTHMVHVHLCEIKEKQVTHTPDF